MKRIGKRLLAAALMALFCCGAAGLARAGEEDVPLDQVPEVVKDAARKAVKGIKLTEAEKVTRGSRILYYELEGTAGGKSYEIKVTPAGKVLKVELDDDDDDEDDDDDDDDKKGGAKK